jgi:ubiquinone/menaquinone biosynthesis C-methylase UbiE
MYAVGEARPSTVLAIATDCRESLDTSTTDPMVRFPSNYEQLMISAEVAVEGLQGQTITGPDRAHLDFYLGLRTGWARLQGPLRMRYEERAAEWAQVNGRAPETTDEIGEVLDTDTLFRYAMYLQRRTQYLMKWGTHGTHAHIESHRDELEKQLNDGISDDRLDGAHATLRLQPRIAMPDWYADVDYHIEKGGYWRDDLDGPAYDFGSRIHWAGIHDIAEVHDWKTSNLPRHDYKRVIDVGCGSGDSTFGMVGAFPEARMTAVDISAPMVKWAFRKAEERGLSIDFAQENAEATTFVDGSFDLVTATMMFHEMPADAALCVLTELHRICEPGGDLAIFTASVPPNAYGQFMADWHAHVNVEPYMADFFRSDLEQIVRDAGFVDVSTKLIGVDPMAPRVGGWRLVSGRKA